MTKYSVVISRDGVPIVVVDDSGNGVGALEWFHKHVYAYSMDHAIKHEGYSVEYFERPKD